jgi:hypothetical protein
MGIQVSLDAAQFEGNDNFKERNICVSNITLHPFTFPRVKTYRAASLEAWFNDKTTSRLCPMSDVCVFCGGSLSVLLGKWNTVTTWSEGEYQSSKLHTL